MSDLYNKKTFRQATVTVQQTAPSFGINRLNLYSVFNLSCSPLDSTETIFKITERFLFAY